MKTQRTKCGLNGWKLSEGIASQLVFEGNIQEMERLDEIEQGNTWAVY